MIKILTPGITSKYTHTCPYCMCTYEYEAEDVSYMYGLNGNQPYIMCPCCGKRNDVFMYIPFYPAKYPFEVFYNGNGTATIECKESLDNIRGGQCQCKEMPKS